MFFLNYQINYYIIFNYFNKPNNGGTKHLSDKQKYSENLAIQFKSDNVNKINNRDKNYKFIAN